MACLHKDVLDLFRVLYVLWVVNLLLLDTVVSCSGQYDSDVDRFIIPSHRKDDRTTPQLHTYCNHHYMISGQEGHSPIGHTLTGAYVVLTPGESNNVYSQGQGQKPSLACSISSGPLSTEKILSFQDTANIYRTVHTERHGFKEFHPVFHETCTKHQLTDMGFKQLIVTGEHLLASYFTQPSPNKLMPKSFAVHAESFPNHKSYQSSLALLHGLLPEKKFVQQRIHKTPDNFCDTVESELTSCRCDVITDLMPYVMQAIDRGRYMFKDSIPDIGKLRDLFGEYHDNGLSPIQLSRAIRRAKCNALSTVCDEHGKCFNLTQQIETEIKHITAQFLNILFSDKTFRLFSEVTAYPFLQRIANSISTQSERLGVYTGTDYYLEFLRTSLGISRDTLLPTASRFVFEVYQRDETETNMERYYIRVLLNGEDVTGQVEGCNGHLENRLCPASNFKSLVAALRHQYTQKC